MLSQTDVLNKVLLGSLQRMLEEAAAMQSSDDEDGEFDDHDPDASSSSSSSAERHRTFPNEAIRVALTKKVPERDGESHGVAWRDNLLDDISEEEVRGWAESDADEAQVISQAREMFGHSASQRSSSSSARLGLHVLTPRLYWQPVDSTDLSILVEVDSDEEGEGDDQQQERDDQTSFSSSSSVNKGRDDKKKNKKKKKRGGDDKEEEEEEEDLDDTIIPSSEEFGFKMSSDIWAFEPPVEESLQDTPKRQKRKRDTPPQTIVPEALKAVHDLFTREGVCDKSSYYRPETIQQTDQLMDQLLSLAGGSKMWILIDRDFVDELSLDQNKDHDVIKSLTEQQWSKAVVGLIIIRERYLQNTTVKSIELLIDRKHREASSMAKQVLSSATHICFDRSLYSSRRVEIMLMDDDHFLLSIVRDLEFILEATLRQLFSKHGSICDALLFSLLADDFGPLLLEGRPFASRLFSILP